MAEQQLASPLTTPGVLKFASFIHHRFVEVAVRTFAELGIADLLASTSRPQTADELAHSQGWDTECLYRVLRVAGDADIVHEIQSDQTQNTEPGKTNRFELTEAGRLLTSDHPSKTRYMLLLELSPFSKTASDSLPKIVREGYAKGNGMDEIIGNRSLFDYFKDEENRELNHSFNEAMTHHANSSAQAVVKAFDFSQFNTLVDIGGNLGVTLSAILAKYSTIKQGICFDLPNVVQQPMAGREFEQRKVPKDRYQFVGGDMFDAKTIPQADAYIMQNVVHDWDDERCIDLLKAIRTAANGQRTTVLIVGFIILPQTDDNKLLNWHAHGMDLHMMVLSNAKERTEKQHQYLLEQSGFVFKRLYRTESPISIIEATANY